MSEEIRETVRKRYAQAITQKTGCCGGGNANPSCCGGDPLNQTSSITANLYQKIDLEGLPEDMVTASFGCGNPTLLAQLHPGEVVLDLGSGAGLDVFLSAKRVAAG